MGLKINGSTSGSIEIDVPAVAGTDTSITIPAKNGGTFIVEESTGNIDLGPLDINGSASDDSVNIDGSGRLLVGTTAARTNINNSSWGGNVAVNIEGNALYGNAVNIVSNYNGNAYTMLNLCKSNGSAIGSNTVVSNGDTLGMITFQGNDGTEFVQGATIQAIVDGTPGANDMPGRLVFSTTPDGASSPTARTIIDLSGTLRPAADNTYQTGSLGTRWTAVWAVNGTIQTSDERLKTEITDSVLASDFIKSLRPVSYKWIEGGKTDSGERDENGDPIYESVPGQRTHWGFISQEVKQAADDAGVDFGGWVLGDKDDPESTQSLRYDQFIAPLTKALQEAIAKIETLETANASLEARLTALEGGAS